MKRKLLVVDDLSINRRILNNMLCEEYDISEAGDGQQALSILRSQHRHISAVLLDIVMPDSDGYEVLRQIRADPALRDIPVIMMTGSEGEDAHVKALSCGANDFVLKPYNAELIRHCLHNVISLRESASIISDLRRDKLTRLFNRDAFLQQAEKLIHTQPPGHYIMAFFDVDKFKVINDQYGTAKGDELLVHIADTFKNGFEPHGGLCCRITADNFGVLYPASFMDSQELKRIREDASHVEGIVAPIVFCIGRYLIDDLSLHPSAMLDRAVMAAESVKGRYDVKIALYDESMRSHLFLEQEIVTEMEGALRTGQFEVWYQPQINHSTAAQIGAEALVRWRHPEKGLIQPSQFIPIFEENGFIYELDRFVWEEVCIALRRWLDEGRRPLPVSVNISRGDVYRTDVVAAISELTARYSLPPELLRLEITETAFAQSSQQVIDVVKGLVERGFTVEIDDFGSGYSSLNTLKDVPAQIIKLDMRFLESSNSERGGNIVESVVRMAKWLGMSVIAEGVELGSQADYLRSIGCSYMQGYYFARPMPINEYESYCDRIAKEPGLLKLDTVENLDNNSFWDPSSMDTLIFNSYVGGACIYEYHNGEIELIRATEKYAQVIGSAGMSVEDALKLNWTAHLSPETKERVIAALEESVRTGKEVTGEYVFLDLPGCPHETYLRSDMRVIASAGDRCLVYCTNENITAQRQAERKERLLTQRLRVIMQNMNSGISAMVADSDGVPHTVFSNNKYYSILGYTREQAEAELADIRLVVHPDDRAAAQAEMDRLLADHNPRETEYRCIRRDGSVIYVHANKSFARIGGYDDEVIITVITDITDRVLAEQSMSRTSAQLQVIMDNVDLGIVASVMENGILKVLLANDKFYEMRGYTRSQYIDEVSDPHSLILPEQRQAILDSVQAISGTGRSAVMEYELTRRDGRRRCVRNIISGASFTGIENGAQISIFRDITEERSARQQIEHSSRQLRSMMDDMPGGFVRMSVSPDGSIRPIYFNKGFQTLTGMNSDQLMDIYADDALAGVHPDDVHIVRSVVEELLKKGEARSSRYRLIHKNGAYIWLRIFGRVTRDADGSTYLNIYYSDLSEQMREEEKQKALLDNLPCGAGIYELRGDGMSLVYQNKSYWELVGLSAASFPDTEPISAIHPDDIPVIMQELSMAVQQHRDAQCDIRLHHLTRGYLPVHLSGRIVPGNDGGARVYATFTPISGDGLSYQQVLPLLLSAIMESTTDLSFAKDKDFRYISASHAFTQLFGLEQESDIIGKTDYDLFDKDLADKYRRDDLALLDGGKPLVDMVESIPPENGVPRYSSTSKYLLRDSLGNIVGIYGVGRDVTRAMAQDSQLRLVNDSIPGGLATYICTQGDFTAEHVKLSYFNDGFCRLFGYTRSEYTRRASVDPMEMIYPEDRHLLAEQWHTQMQHGTPVNCLYRVHVNGGGYKWISHKSVTVDRRDGKTVINAILQDVTEQRELIEQLRISETENHIAARLGGNVVCRFLIADKTLSLTPEVAESFSLPASVVDVPEEPIRLGLISLESADAYRGFFQSIIRGSKAATAVFQQKYLGQWRWMEAKSSTVFSADDKPVKAVISFRDITGQIEKETVYKKWQQSLSDKQPDTYTLFRCNLNNSTTYADAEGTLLSFDFDAAGEKFNQRAREYARVRVHEEDRDRYIAFANSDTMLADYYRGHRSDALEYRELLPDGGCRWLRLTADLVEYPNSTDVEAYLMYEDIDREKRAELKTRALAENDPLTGVLNRTAFALRVEQAIRCSAPGTRHALLMLDIDGFKLVNDAFGHVVGDQALVELSAGLRAVLRRDDIVGRLGGDEFVVFLRDIQDKGSAAVKAQQLCAVTRRSYSAEVHISGSVGIAIAPVDGVDFETLYRKADSALYYVKGSGKDSYVFYSDSMAGQHFGLEQDLPVGDGALHPKKRRMLIVDDSAVDFELMQNIFRDDFIVEKARDGGTALIRLRHYGAALSVVLLDLMMPGMDGFDVLKKMQESAELKNVPVIVVSGDDSRETCLRAVKSGAMDYVTKPVDPDLLRLRVHSAISKAENARLRAKNNYLEIQNEERLKFAAAVRSTRIAFVEYDWLSGGFTYYPSISEYLCGCYDARSLWQIMLSDMVTDTATVQRMQQFVHYVAEEREKTDGSITVMLKTPSGQLHRFRMNVQKLTDEYKLTSKLIISFDDLQYGEAQWTGQSEV